MDSVRPVVSEVVVFYDLSIPLNGFRIVIVALEVRIVEYAFFQFH